MEVARRARDGVRDARREAWGVRDLRRESPRVLVVVDAVELAHLVAHHLEGLHVPEWTRGLSDGSLRSILSTSSLVSVQKSPVIGGGDSLQMRITSAGIVFAVNGGSSMQSSKRMPPSDHTSLLPSYSLPSHSSGLR